MAADKLVDSVQLNGAMNATADAIRAKLGSGTDGDMAWDLTDGFSERIGDIVTLVEGTTGDDAISSDILIGKKAHTFNGTPITGTIPLLAGATINLKTTDQTILAGSYISGKQTIRGVSISNTVSASNVRSGVSIKIGDTGSATRFKNFTGTYTSESTSPAANETILSGKIAYVNGTKLTGNIETLTASNITVNGKTIIIPVHKYTGTSSASPITKSIADGDYSADSSTSTNSTVTPSLSITNSSTYGFTTTKPTSGTYQTLTPGFSASAWSVTPRANITTAGYLDVDSKTGDAVTNTPTSGTVTPYYIPVVTPTFGGGALSETKNTNTLIDTPEVTVSASGTFTTKTGYGVTQAKPSGTDGTAYLTINGSGSVTTVGKATSEYGVSRAGVTYSNNPGAIASHTNAAATLSAAASKTGTKDVSITPSVVNDFSPYYIPIVTASFGGGTLSESVNTNQITTTPVVTVSASGTFTTKTGYGVTQTKPSGTDGTAYLTIDGGGSVTTEGKATSNYTVTRANVTYTNSAGAIAAHSSTTATLSASASKSGSKEVAITPEVVDSFDPYYIPIVTASFGGGTLSKTDFTKNDLVLTLEDGADKNVINYTVGAKDTTNYPYYVKVSGSTPAVSGTTTATRAAVTYSNNAGAIAKHTNTTATLSASNTISPSVTVNATSEATYVGFKKATMTIGGSNTVSPSASVTGNTNVTLGTTDNGLAVTATGGGTASASATATTNIAGYAPASTQLGSGTLSGANKTTTQTKYISGITVPSGKSFTMTTNGTTTINSGLNGTTKQGKIVVSSYAVSGDSSKTSKTVVDNGIWSTTNVSAAGTFYGRVVVSSGTITNPATLPSGGSSTQINRGNYIKIGAGFYNSDVYYRAQPNSGTYAITSSNYDGNGGNITVDGYQYATVSAAESSTNAASASITTSSSDSTSITLAETQPSSGNYYTLTANGSGSSKITTAGWIKAGALETTSTTKPYYVTKGVISNNQSSGTSSGTVNRGKKIKIGKGYYPADLYYTAQANSGTVTISGSGNTTCDGYVTASVAAASSDADTAAASITTASSDSTSITLAETQPSSGNYYTLTANGSGNSKVISAGWIAAGSLATASTTKNYYVTKGVISNNQSSGTSSGTINRGKKIKIGKGYYPADLYYTAQANSGTVTISKSGDTSCDGKVTVTVPAATPTFDGGTLSGGSTAVGTNCAINTTANNGITIQTKYSGASTDVLYNGAVNGWVTMADNAQALAGKTLSSTNGTLYYLTGVNVPSDAPFSLTTIEGTDLPNSSAMVSITNNAYRILSIQNKAHGTVSITANTGNVDVRAQANGNGSYVTVAAYDTESSSNQTTQVVVSNGRWSSPSVTAAGTYYGRVVVPSATPAFKGGALNNQGATITSTNATVSTSSNNSGVTITAKGTAGRAAVTYNGAVSGFVKVSNGATASAAVSAATWDGTTYYLNGVELTAGKTFTITVPNGSASNKINFVFHVDNNNNVTVTET